MVVAMAQGPHALFALCLCARHVLLVQDVPYCTATCLTVGEEPHACKPSRHSWAACLATLQQRHGSIACWSRGCWGNQARRGATSRCGASPQCNAWRFRRQRAQQGDGMKPDPGLVALGLIVRGASSCGHCDPVLGEDCCHLPPASRPGRGAWWLAPCLLLGQMRWIQPWVGARWW